MCLPQKRNGKEEDGSRRYSNPHLVGNAHSVLTTTPRKYTFPYSAAMTFYSHRQSANTFLNTQNDPNIYLPPNSITIYKRCKKLRVVVSGFYKICSKFFYVFGSNKNTNLNGSSRAELPQNNHFFFFIE